MSAQKPRILVSGGGIAGPCFAYWLAKTGLETSIKIVERSPIPRITGQSVDVRGSAVDIIKQMKLEEAVRAKHTKEEGTILVNSSGKPFARFEAGEVFTADYEILRADLSKLFLQATESLENVRYTYGDSIQSLEQTDKAVHVTFQGGSREVFDLVVGADGATSRTRSLILEKDVAERSYDFIGQYTAFFSISSRPTDPKLWQWYNVPKGLALMIRPHVDPSTVGVYICVTTSARGQRDQGMEDAMNEGTEATKRKLRKYFEHVGWQATRILDGMDNAQDFYISRAAEVKLSQWTSNRAALIGDAALATFGVGTSLAIQSGYVLAGELSKIKNSGDIPLALKSYEEVFRKFHEQVGGLPNWYPQVPFPQTSVALWLRDTLLWFVSKTRLYKLLPGDENINFKLPHYDWIDI